MQPSTVPIQTRVRLARLHGDGRGPPARAEPGRTGGASPKSASLRRRIRDPRGPSVVGGGPFAARPQR